MPTELQERDALAESSPLPPAQLFEQLLDEHGAAVLGTIRRLCGHVHDAEDVFQDTAARVWRHLQSQPVLRNPRAWLMAVAYRAFCDARARRPKQGEFVEPPDVRHPPADDQAEQADEQQRLNRAIDGLPEIQRSVIALHYASGLSLRETADAIGISEGTVKSRLNAALARLRSTLQ
jgi:RNA polymerase sigma-70 factor (ECF subfamily)